jgi:cyanophycin synthetase
VLNAADPRVAELALLCDGEVIFFSVSPQTPALAAHRKEGGRAVFVRDGQIVLATGTDESAVTEIAAIACDGERLPIAENVLAAAGAAWALGIPAELIRAGIESSGYGDADAVR